MAPAAPGRLGWLDALRGVAALVVVFDHASYSYLPAFRQELAPVFNTSRYGIMVFFLVSGYVIPASLERRGDVRAFWAGRVFRVYPLAVAVVAVVLVAALLGIARIRGLGEQSAATAALAHATLLQELLGTPNLLLVLWTLSYEMAFYLLVVALFTVGLHRRSAAVAVVLAVPAAVSTLVALPASALSGALGTGPLIVLASAAMVAAIGCACARPPALRVFGGLLGGVLALALVTLNGTIPTWEGLVILAVMFLGTAVHRAEHGEASWRFAGCAAAVVITCAVGSAFLHGDGARFTRRGWLTAFLLAVLTFGIGFASRHRRTPRLLAGLGTISYSVYLVHPVLLAVNDGTLGRSPRDDVVLVVAFHAVLLPLCVLTYRFVEAPGRRWGRALTRDRRSTTATPAPPRRGRRSRTVRRAAAPRSRDAHHRSSPGRRPCPGG